MQDIPLGRQGLLDMSAIVWAGLLVGEDKEFGRKVLNDQGKEVQVNSHTHGAWNATEHILHLMREYKLVPRDLIMVMDGEDAKRLRRSMFADYKAGRDKVPELYVEFNKAMETVKQQFLAVGASAVQQQYREADDVLAYLALNLPCPVVISSVDNDLAVLQSDRIKTYIGNNENYNKYGLWPAKYISLYKALVGDSSDNIKGVKGFGDVAFQKLYTVFGEEGLDCMIDLLNEHALDRLVEDVDQLKELSKILADQEGAYLGWNLARLYPEKINTGRCPLTWEVGMVKPFRQDWTDSRLAKWSGRVTLVHGGNYEAAFASVQRRVAETPWYSLDIETDTSEDSKEWMEAASKARGDDEVKGVDVFGSELVSMGLTFGDNGQFTVYLTHNHVEQEGVPNLTVDQVREFVESFADKGIPCVIQNLGFELPILHRTWGEKWADNGWHGFIPNCYDTKLEASYVNENVSTGLKQCSALYLGYEQTTYAEVTKGRGMSEMTAYETIGYGADDPICTAALHQHYMRIMLLEGSWSAYQQAELLPQYLSAKSYNDGQKWSLERVLELEQADAATRDKAWAKLRTYLMEKGWDGTLCPTYGPEVPTPAQVKEAYQIVTGKELETQVRMLPKLATAIEAEGYDDLAEAVRRAGNHDYTLLNALVKSTFTGEPTLNFDSPKQVSKLLYQTIGIPVRLRNKPTDGMRKALPALKQALEEARAAGVGIAEAEEKLDTAKNGNAKTDDLAILYALKHDAPERPEIAEILRAYQAIRTADTKAKMFYRPYRFVQHWKDGKVRPQYNQSATNTRRHTCSSPNQQQMPKHEKHGEVPQIRSVVLPHHKDAVVVSLDFSGQELRVIADYSRDQNMLDCFIGENKKDMHSLTAAGIVKRKSAAAIWDMLNPGVPAEGPEFTALKAKWSAMDYDTFMATRKDKDQPDSTLFDKVFRPLGKKCNFTTEFGAQAPKLAETLLVSEEEAQTYIDAKYQAFARAEAWKKEVIAEAHAKGFVTTKLGAVRHLAEALYRGEGYERSKAERQSVNFKVQSSSAEMTKMAMARCWKADLLYRYDCQFYGPIHDELVWSVHRKETVAFIRELNALMTAPYADMEVPIVASASLGLNFKDQIECGDYFDEAAIQRALDELFGGVA